MNLEEGNSSDSMLAQAERVYIDTMIFVNQLFNKEHRWHLKSKSFFYDVQNQKYIGITSTFTRAEYIAVVKESLANRHKSIPSLSDIGSALRTFDDFVDDMGIEIFDSDDLVSSSPEFFMKCSQQIQSSIAIQGSDNIWRTLNGADSVILSFAERSNANLIATNDDGFKGTNSHVRPLIPREVY